MKKHLVLAGGGHAHMMTLANLHQFVERGHRVTVIQPSAYHYYSGMGPGMLGTTYRPEEIRFATKHVVKKKGGTFVLGKIARVDPEAKTVALESGESLPFDVISFNVGSHVPRNPHHRRRCRYLCRQTDRETIGSPTADPRTGVTKKNHHRNHRRGTFSRRNRRKHLAFGPRRWKPPARDHHLHQQKPPARSPARGSHQSLCLIDVKRNQGFGAEQGKRGRYRSNSTGLGPSAGDGHHFRGRRCQAVFGF